MKRIKDKLQLTAEDLILVAWTVLGVVFFAGLLWLHIDAIVLENDAISVLSFVSSHKSMLLTGATSLGLMVGMFIWLLRSRISLQAKTQELIQLKDELELKVAIRTQELQDAVEELEVLASIDVLTQISNRRQIKHLFREEYLRSRRTKRPMSLIMFDIDHFKNVNDTYGHPVGDEVLTAVAATVKKSLRDIDFFGRIGGEEFLIVLPETELAPTLLTAERIRQCVEGLTTSNHDVKVTISLGVVATNVDCRRSLNELLEDADTALYEAKDGGRNCVKYLTRG